MSFGLSKSSSKQQATSSSEGANAATSFGVTGSEQSAANTSSSTGRSTSSQDVFLADLFKQVYGGAAGAAGAINPDEISGAARSLFTGGVNFLDELGGGAGADALKARVGDTSSRDAQLASLKSELGDFFNTNLAPGITRAGVATGTLGGSRDAVDLAEASKAVASKFSTGAASIISADQAQRDAAAGKLADVTNAGAGTGLSALQSLYGLASAGATSGLLPYQILSSIIGGPTVLGQSQSMQDATSLGLSSGTSFGEQGSQSYGFNTSQSQSTGNASAWGVSGGIGGGGGAKP
jgi:hypothetical protein